MSEIHTTADSGDAEATRDTKANHAAAEAITKLQADGTTPPKVDFPVAVPGRGHSSLVPAGPEGAGDAGTKPAKGQPGGKQFGL